MSYKTIGILSIILLVFSFCLAFPTSPISVFRIDPLPFFIASTLFGACYFYFKAKSKGKTTTAALIEALKIVPIAILVIVILFFIFAYRLGYLLS